MKTLFKISSYPHDAQAQHIEYCYHMNLNNIVLTILIYMCITLIDMQMRMN
jgi:hypothetical protein